MNTVEVLGTLVKALEAGSYNVAPGLLNQGAALQIENLETAMQNVTYQNEDLILQKEVKTIPCKATTYQFDRQLSYGNWGGSAQNEGVVGQYDDSDFVRDIVPMAYYSTLRRVTIPANLVQTIDGKKAEDRAASDAAMKLAGDIEFDLFRGKADFSNAGVFDGNDLVIARIPNMKGIDPQVRRSDFDTNTQDLMFAEYGSNLSVVIAGGGVLTQVMIENAYTRSRINFGSPSHLLVDNLVLSAYSQAQASAQRIVLGGSAQNAVGQDIRKQWVCGGTVALEASRFLSGKFTVASSARQKTGVPGAPTAGAVTQTAGTTAFVSGAKYYYSVSASNEIGEGLDTLLAQVTISTTGNYVTIPTLAATNSPKYFNVYRTGANGAAATRRFIGRVAVLSSSTSFIDLGNKVPGFVTGFMLQPDSMVMPEMQPYSRIQVATQDLTKSEIHFRFVSLAVWQPRKSVLIDNLIGNF